MNGPPITDAVVVLPGIMGSELVDADGRVVWGMRLQMARAFLSHVYDGAAVTPEELEGNLRLTPSRLITRTGILSAFGSQGPYTELVEKLGCAAADPAAVKPFPYDWRLSIEHNGALLARFALEHLQQWKQTLRGIVARTNDGPLRRFDVDRVRLSFVAHSMGGLVARWACLHNAEVAAAARRIVSLGTPYQGSAKTVGVITGGESPMFLDNMAAQKLAVSCPGFYDLLPRERCVADDTGGWRRLDADDVESMGGSRGFAVEASDRWATIDPSLPVSDVVTIPIVGYTMPTSLTVRRDSAGGWVHEAIDWDGYRSHGDGTVANRPPPSGSVVQRCVSAHAQLADFPKVIEEVVLHLMGVPEAPIQLAPPRELGLSAPSTASPGQLTVRITELGEESPSARGITVTSATETAEGQWGEEAGWTFIRREDNELLFSRGLAAGVHQIRATGGGNAGVSCTTAVLKE